MLPGLLLFLGWGAGWLAGFGLALAADVLPQAGAQLSLKVAIAGIVSGAIAALLSRPRDSRASAITAVLAGAAWAVAWAIGWLAAWAAGIASSGEYTNDFYSLTLSLQSPVATAVVLWFHIEGLAGLVSGIVAAIVAVPILPRPGQGYLPVARLGFLVFWPDLWTVGWLSAGSLQAAIGAGMRMRGNGVQLLSLTGAAIGGALLGALLLRIFHRQGVGQASKRHVRERGAHA